MNYPKRKPTRLQGYDYSTHNYYFVTICTHEKQRIFGSPGNLNFMGQIAEECLKKIPEIYPDIKLEKYVIMPNHIHAILLLGLDATEKSLPSVSDILGRYKAAVTKKIRKQRPGMIVWQRTFNDRIVRNQPEFENIWNYIEGNPSK